MKLKPVIWVGSSKSDMLKFSDEIIRSFGHGLHYAQKGEQYIHSKVLKGFSGASVIELKESDESGTYRLIYTIKLPKAIFVLHAFQKKSKHGIKTSTQEIELIKRRLKVAEELYKELIYGNKI